MRTKTHVIAGTLVACEGQPDARGGCTTSGPLPAAISPARRPLDALSRRIMKRIGAFIVFAGLIGAAKGQPVVPPVHLHPCDCVTESTASQPVIPCSCDCRVPGRPKPIAQEDVVGTWFISLSHSAGTAQALITFHSDGTVTSASADFGVWAGLNGEHSATYYATTDAFTFDEHGVVMGRLRTRWSVVVTTFDQLQAHFVVDLIALDGTITRAAGSGTAAGCRVPLEPQTAPQQ